MKNLSVLRGIVISLLVVVTVISLVLSNSPNETWFSGMMLNFGTEMLGAIVTFILLTLVIGSIEARQEREEIVDSVISGVVAQITEIQIQKSGTSEVFGIGERIQRVGVVLRHISILWIDDYPENNKNEISILNNLKVNVDTAKSSAEAKQKLNMSDYDIILSDISRNGDTQAGFRFFEDNYPNIPYTIFYTGGPIDHGETTSKAFGITVSPNELFHLILDAAERIHATKR